MRASTACHPSPIIHWPNPATPGAVHCASPTKRWHMVDEAFEQTTAHKWRPSETRGTTAQASRGNLETSIAFASSFTGTHETSDTFARPQCRKNTHFGRAKVMAVSPTHEYRAAKVTAVSWQRVAPKRQAMHQFARHCGDEPPPPQFRMQFQLSPTPGQRRIRRIPTIRLQTMKHIRGNCMRNCWAGRDRFPEISHVIQLSKVSTKSENVAIPTMGIQCLKESQGNYV